MKRETAGQILSAVFVDYDNIYLSLKRKNEEAAKRFAKDAGVWLSEIETGRLITPTNKLPAPPQRRVVLNRCYGNPVPRRNQTDNSTDMNSFPFVRHHFLRAGFEIVDCPPLTAQLKNSSDIRMVMDVRDYLHHDTYFDEFIILSGDADFTPVLHRLRAHARRTVVFANDFTAAPYVAIADGEIRESDLISLILEGKLGGFAQPSSALPGRQSMEDIRRDIIAEVTSAVRHAAAPVPLEVLAERATRTLGHERTVGTNWAGAGSFRELLLQSLPEAIRLSEQPPYVAFDAARQVATDMHSPHSRGERIERQAIASPAHQPAGARTPAGGLPGASAAAQLSQALEPANVAIKRTIPHPPQRPAQQPLSSASPPPVARAAREMSIESPAAQGQRVAAPAAASPAARGAEVATALQQSIARIHDACQAPPLSPPEYRALFELMAKEINENGLQGSQTFANIANRGREMGLEFRRDDIRFVLDVVSEPDPWFEQGASANLFAGRFRNFVVARCRGHGLNLTPDEIDLIDAWFTGAGAPSGTASRPAAAQAQPAPQASAPSSESRGDRWWSLDDRQAAVDTHSTNPRTAPSATGYEPQLPAGQPNAPGSPETMPGDEFPRIVRTRLRG